MKDSTSLLIVLLSITVCSSSLAFGAGHTRARLSQGVAGAQHARLSDSVPHPRTGHEPESAETPCAATTRLALDACIHDTRGAFLTQLGKCVNLSETDPAEDCALDAAAVRTEEAALCRERRDERTELCEKLGPEAYDPLIDPSQFLSPEEIAHDPNPYFPLVPGNRWVYETEDEIITVVVTDETLEIEGVDCIQVRDVVRSKVSGEPIEMTLDWYSQNLEGDVWYFGELAENFEDGRLVDLEGSWVAGEDLAHAGVLLPKVPVGGQIYRQEFALREAEDVAEVVEIDADGAVEGFSCDNACLLTLEYSPLEPGVAEEKIYLPGVGMIFSRDPETGQMIDVLTEFSQAAP